MSLLSFRTEPLLPQASHIAELRSNSLPTGRYVPVAEADNSSGAHIHDNKRIGDLFPGSGYGTSILLHRDSKVQVVTLFRQTIIIC